MLFERLNKMGKVRLERVLLTLILMALALPSSLAHLAAGVDKEVDGYAIDMGHDPEVITAGEPFTLALGISNSTTEEQLNPKKVWVRILRNEGDKEIVVFAGTFAPEARSVSTLMSLPSPGTYTMDVRFFGEGPKAWAVVDFPLTAAPKKASGMVMTWVIAALGIAILLIGYYVWYTAKTTPPIKK